MNKKYKIFSTVLILIITIFIYLGYNKYYKTTSYVYNNTTSIKKYDNGFIEKNINWEAHYKTTVIYYKLHNEWIKNSIDVYSEIILSTYFQTVGIQDTIHINSEMLKGKEYNPYELVDSDIYELEKIIILHTNL